MHYPETVTFGGVKFNVVLSDEMLQHPTNPNRKFHGVMLPSSKAILLYNDVACPTSTEETFIHEVLEAIDTVYDLRLPHSSIKTIGVAMHQVLSEHGKTLFGDEISTKLC